MSGYYVRRQGDDSDYLEHSIFSGIKERAHKYLAKLPSPGGGFRYIYNQAELAAARAGNAISSVRRKAADAIGLTARSRMKTAERVLARSQRNSHGQPSRYSGAGIFSRNARKARDRYGRTILGRAENAAMAARQAIGDAVGRARKTGAGVLGSIKREAYKVGGQIGGAANKARKAVTGAATNAVNTARKTGQNAINAAGNAFNSARRSAGKAINEAGRAVNNAVGTARRKGAAAIDAAVGAGRGAATQVRRAAGDAVRAGRSAVGRGIKAARGAAGDAREVATNAARAATKTAKNAVGAARRKGAAAIDATVKGVKKTSTRLANASGYNALKSSQRAYDDYRKAIDSGHFNTPGSAKLWNRYEKRRAAASKTPLGAVANAYATASERIGERIPDMNQIKSAVGNVFRRGKKKKKK